MRVVRAEAMGLCFGVRDALEVAFARTDADEITVYGELVHNETVNEQLHARGYRLVPEDARENAVDTAKALVTAHGISNREREHLIAAGKELVDTTCPLVQKVHNAALRLQEAGFFPVVIGKHGHVEVRGVVGDLDTYAVVATEAEAADLGPLGSRIGVVCQTTFPEPVAERIVATLRRHNPDAEVRFHNTVCEPTRQRRAAVEKLIQEVDAVVVVGGKNSNNTRQLVRACEVAGVRAVQVQSEADLDPSWFEGCQVVGLTAGTSTLDATIDRVEAALHRLGVPSAVGSHAPSRA